MPDRHVLALLRIVAERLEEWWSASTQIFWHEEVRQCASIFYEQVALFAVELFS